MINTLVTFVVSIVISILFYAFTKKKWLVISICCILVIASCVFIYWNNTRVSKLDDFFLPFLDYSLNYDMTRADILNILNNEGEEIIGIEDEFIAIKKEWLDVIAIAFFYMDDTNRLECVSWGQIVAGNYVLPEDRIKQLENDLLTYLDNCYGERKVSEVDLSYYWENSIHYKVTFVGGTDYFMAFWWDPEADPISIPIDVDN